jgi:hypothetical protein
MSMAALFCFLSVLVLLAAGCSLDSGSEGPRVYTVDLDWSDLGLPDGGGGKTSSVFVVKVNNTGRLVPWEATGHVYDGPAASRVPVQPSRSGAVSPAPLPQAPVSGLFSGAGGETVVRYDHPGAQRFNANPPPLDREIPGGPQLRSMSAPSFSVVDVSQKSFWVDKGIAGGNYIWEQKTATLRADSTHAEVWVADESYNNGSSSSTDNKVTTAQAQAVAAKFDEIYGPTTAVFGYEYGGGPGPGYPGYPGGRDENPKIQILIYDIDGDYNAGQTGGVIGYFWGKDWYEQWQFDASGYKYKSNEAEIFYIDAHFTDSAPGTVHSTLIHEYQHMIHWNEKEIKGLNSQTWYNEMLSMLAEDMIAPLIGISSTDSGHPVRQRIPLFLDCYSLTGITEWGDPDTAEELYSYSNVYAFGAYLARNYGGADLIKAMAGNGRVNEASVSAALGSVGANPLVRDFGQALSKYGEALIYKETSGDRGSFNKTDKRNINGTDYEFTGFNIMGTSNSSGSLGDYVLSGTKVNKGPLIFNLQYAFEMPPHSIIVQSRADWLTVNGPLTVTVEEYPGVEIRILTRPNS